MSAVNVLLHEFNESPLNSIDSSIPGRTEDKLDVLVNKLKFLLIENFAPDTIKNDLEEIINLIRTKFKTLDNYADKIQILTILPPSWTLSKIANEIGCTKYMAQEAQNLQTQHGILARPKNKKYQRLTEETKKLVISFYCQDDVSRIMPGKKDYINVKTDGLKMQIQKRLI